MEANQMDQETASKMTPEELKQMQDKLERSQQDFNKRNTVNGMTVHYFSAMLNGMYSNGVEWNNGDVASYYKAARDMAEFSFDNNQAYLDEGAREMEGVQ